MLTGLTCASQAAELPEPKWRQRPWHSCTAMRPTARRSSACRCSSAAPSLLDCPASAVPESALLSERTIHCVCGRRCGWGWSNSCGRRLLLSSVLQHNWTVPEWNSCKRMTYACTGRSLAGAAPVKMGKLDVFRSHGSGAAQLTPEREINPVVQHLGRPLALQCRPEQSAQWHWIQISKWHPLESSCTAFNEQTEQRIVGQVT